ncbi:uncharacterized protein BDV14DRAFT_188300 [Aspergillus stella-maris]|uniref:uncharacterized protein n=1 Tax=Aspergillus stella-maris TaxID=1810926 RepID=UPI003CCCB4A6
MFERYASPNEQRTISREDLGFYNAVVIAAVYEVPDDVDVDLTSPDPFVEPLRQCVLDQPYLSVVVKNKHTDKASYVKVESLNLSQHISILHDQKTSDDTENKIIERALLPILDRPWPADVPPWRIVVLPLAPASANNNDPKAKRYLIAFSFSHALGDGISGLIFHRAFLNAWNNTIASTNPATKSNNETLIVTSSPRTLPPPFDTPSRLPISWSFLLTPLLAALLPTWVNDMFGLRASSSPRDKSTWTGARMFFDRDIKESSRLRLLEIDAPLLQHALRVCRTRDVKFTGVLHQIIVAALGRALAEARQLGSESEITNLVSGTAINMRSSIGVGNDEWGLFVSGGYAVHPVPLSHPTSPTETEKPNLSLTEDSWTSARNITTSLASVSVRLKDQAIGLLRYAPSIRSWTASHVGGLRDCSYRVSNLLVFDGKPERESEDMSKSNNKVCISKTIFATPADVTGSPLALDIVSTQGGSLVAAVGWQGGALGLVERSALGVCSEVDEVEGRFIDGVLEFTREGFEALQ